MTNIFNEMPRFEHDCENCTFIKSYLTENLIRVDQYVHVKTRTVIEDGKLVAKFDLNIVERYSDLDSDYQSWTMYGVPYSESD